MFVTTGSRATRKRSAVSAPLALNFGTIASNPGEPTPGMALSIYGTFNNSGTVFDAPLFMNVTNTASAGGSLLADFQVGATSQLKIDTGGGLTLSGTNQSISVPGGTLTIGGTGSAYPIISVGSFGMSLRSVSNDSGNGGGSVQVVTNSGVTYRFNTDAFSQTAGLTMGFNFGVIFTSGSAAYNGGVVGDIAIGRNQGNILQTYNPGGSSPTSLWVYNVGTRGENTNYERGVIDWNTTGNVFTIGTQAGGTGTIRPVSFVVGNNIIFNWPRVTSDFSRSNSTAATAITGISSVPVGQTGPIRNYKFEAWLATAGSTAGGISIAITCTSSTITALSVDGFILDSNVVRGQQGVITSTTVPVVNSSAITSSAPTVRLQGLIRGVSSGLFGLSLAQSTANATAVVVSSGSWLEVFDVP